MFPTLPPPSPIWIAPALMVVVPLQVLAPVKIVVPEPDWVRLPVPLMASETLVLLVRSKVNAALSVTFPVPSAPVAPALPIWSVPALMEVVPL